MKIILILLLNMLIFCDVYAQFQTSTSQPSVNSSGFSIGAFAGPSLLVEKAPDSLVPEIQDYFNKLRSGWHYGFQAEYYLNKYIGVGARYNRFITKQAVDSIVLQIFSQTFYIDLSSNMSIHAIAPMAYGRLPVLHNKLTITGGIGPVWLFYRNIGKAVGDSAMFKGSSPGLSTSLSVCYEIMPRLGICIQGNYIHAFLKKFTQDNGTTKEEIILEEENYQNISRMDGSFGIIYKLY